MAVGIQTIRAIGSAITTGAKTVNKDIIGTAARLGKGAQSGWQCCSRLAQMKDMSTIGSTVTKAKGALRQTSIGVNELPAVLGGIGTVIPLPLTSVVGYGLGKAIQAIAKIAK